MAPSRLEFGRAIETLRTSVGLSREEAARLAKMSPSYLSEIERGLKRPSADIVARIARALGIKSGGLMQYVEDLSAPAPEDDAPARAVQMSLKRGRALPLFAADETPGSQTSPRTRRRTSASETRGDLVANELLVIVRRLTPRDRLAVLQLARHLLTR